MKVLLFTRYWLFLCFLFLGMSMPFAQTQLKVMDPQNWYDHPGSIDEASLVIKPKGIYMEVNMYLTFSAQESFFYPEDTLEVILDFKLPEDAIVHDSWLWIDDEIIKADIIDRWTASEIYEEIVDRRQDPSILFKDGADVYQLRIFPMAANSTRMVKISYLTPTKWRNGEVLVDLPYEILAASYVPLETVEVITYLDPEWSEPNIKQLEDSEFFPVNNPDLGTFWKLDVPGSIIPTGLTFSVKSPPGTDIYANRYGASGIYQLAFSPAELFDIEDVDTNRVVFVLSHFPQNTNNVTKGFLVSELKQVMQDELSEGDLFNLYFEADLSGGGFSENWIPFSATTIDAILGGLVANTIPDNQALSSLLHNAIDFVVENGGDAEIVVLSNSQAEGELGTANLQIDQLQERIGEHEIRIHVVDYQNANFSYYWSGWNEYVLGNEYFYRNLTRFTGGNYERVGTLTEKLRSALQQATALTGTLDLYTTLEDGFCYQRYNLGSGTDLVDLRQPILQVGRYQGNFPLKVIANAFYNENAFSEEITLTDTEVFFADTLSEEVWAGRYIHTLESSLQSNQNIGEIIDRSMAERVLSLYTAFLCLEPSQGGEPCVGCIDETGGEVVVQDTEVDQAEAPVVVTAFPNPFAQSVKLRLELQEEQRLQDYEFRIVNAYGQVVKAFDEAAVTKTAGAWEIIWNAAAENMPAGVYFFVMERDDSTLTYRLIYLK